MSFKAVVGILQLIRPANVLIIMMVIGASVILAAGATADLSDILLAALAGGLIGGGANAINDYYDVAIDRINKPRRPIPSGAVTPGAAVVTWVLLSIGGISLNLFLPLTALWISAAAAGGLWFYSAVLKGTVLFGNLLVSVMTALAFVYGAVVAGAPQEALFPALFAFLINLGREILKDIEDVEGDRSGHARTMPVRFGPSAASAVATGVFLMLMGGTVVPFTLGVYGTRYLVLVAVVDALLCYVIFSMWMNRSPVNLGRLNTILKAGMVLGLAAIYFGR